MKRRWIFSVETCRLWLEKQRKLFDTRTHRSPGPVAVLKWSPFAAGMRGKRTNGTDRRKWVAETTEGLRGWVHDSCNNFSNETLCTCFLLQTKLQFETRKIYVGVRVISTITDWCPVRSDGLRWYGGGWSWLFEHRLYTRYSARLRQLTNWRDSQQLTSRRDSEESIIWYEHLVVFRR